MGQRRYLRRSGSDRVPKGLPRRRSRQKRRRRLTEAAALCEEGGADSGLLVGLEVVLAEAEHDRRLADGRLAEEDELDLDGASRGLLSLLLLLVGVHGERGEVEGRVRRAAPVRVESQQRGREGVYGCTASAQRPAHGVCGARRRPGGGLGAMKTKGESSHLVGADWERG